MEDKNRSGDLDLFQKELKLSLQMIAPVGEKSKDFKGYKYVMCDFFCSLL